MKITQRAPAKINLMLHVVQRLVDGYHHLQSLIAFADIGDEITIEKAESSSLTVDGPYASHVPLAAENSMIMAARWSKERFPEIDQIHLHLTKNLPIASGIGGGSSDAAATIAGLLKCYGISLSEDEEEALILASGELGADVPVCLAHQFGWGPLLWIDSSGRETLPIPLDIPVPGVLVLVNPGVGVSTRSIFSKIHPPYTLPQDFINGFATHFAGDLLGYLKAQKNDLMEVAVAQEPKIGKVIQALQKAPGCLLARMSGSGATCFALFEDEQSAKSALTRKMPLAWGTTCTLLGQS
jgi:4-diphosphocytidyl-2-C-methyl-D-erythritol kinase